MKNKIIVSFKQKNLGSHTFTKSCPSLFRVYVKIISEKRNENDYS